MHKRGLCRRTVRARVHLSVRLSLCLSVTLMYSVETNKHIFKKIFTTG